MPSKIDYSMGIAIYLQNCSFLAEISREGVPEMVANIDAELSNLGIPSNDTVWRISSVMQSINTYAEEMIAGDLDQETGISEIAYGFVYSYVKQRGTEDLKQLRGIIGCLVDGKLYLNPCLDKATYDKAIAVMNETAASAWHDSDIPMVDRTPKKPTIQ